MFAAFVIEVVSPGFSSSNGNDSAKDGDERATRRTGGVFGTGDTMAVSLAERSVATSHRPIRISPAITAPPHSQKRFLMKLHDAELLEGLASAHALFDRFLHQLLATGFLQRFREDFRFRGTWDNANA